MTKKLLSIALLVFALFLGGQAVMPEMASANVKLDYGQKTSAGYHYFWYVETNTIKRWDSHQANVMVSQENENANMGYRRYFFREKKGVWEYKYDEWTGKGTEQFGSPYWKKTSKSRLANDVLYIVLNQ